VVVETGEVGASVESGAAGDEHPAAENATTARAQAALAVGRIETNEDQSVAVIIPAPTVTFVPSSIKMKPPVSRLRSYGSQNSGWVVRSVTRPIPLSGKAEIDSSRCRLFTSSW
jgi:hypothetical protein